MNKGRQIGSRNSLRLNLGLATLLLFYLNPVYAQEQWPFSFFLHTGAAIDRNAPLVQILRLSIPNIESFYQTTGGVDFQFWRSHSFALESELSFTQYYEGLNRVAGQATFVLRLYDSPWFKVIPGSFAFGNGLSYASVAPEVEELALGRTSRLLYHLFIEFEFTLKKKTPWSAFVRVHHRSGIFGLFDGVTGGSDYLCLGIRYRP